MAPSSSPTRGARAGRRRPVRRALGFVGRLIRGVVLLGIGYILLCILLLVAYRWFPPPATTVQAQRSMEQLFSGQSPGFRYTPVEAQDMDPDIRRAVVAAEDARFYQHFGFDLVELRRAREDAVRRGRPMRGASTITQQLVKNLFLTNHRLILRKAIEVPLTLMAEVILPKERILTLYLNVAEWGPGVFGVEEAARYHYGTSAGALSRTQASRLAAVLPNPLERDPDNMGGTASRIRRRMGQMGW